MEQAQGLGYYLVNKETPVYKNMIFDKAYHLRLKGTHDLRGYFIPTGFTSTYSYEPKDSKKGYRELKGKMATDAIRKIAVSYWGSKRMYPPGGKGFHPDILLPNKYDYPCYRNISESVFEKWQEIPHASPKQKKSLG